MPGRLERNSDTLVLNSLSESISGVYHSDSLMHNAFLPFTVFVVGDTHLVINGAVIVMLRKITLTPIYQSLRQVPKGGALITLAISDVNLHCELRIQVCVFKPISPLSAMTCWLIIDI